VVTNISANTVNRVVCYCDDCQAFLHHLARKDLFDAYGGPDIVQIAPQRPSRLFNVRSALSGCASRQRACKKAANETVVFACILWHSKEVREKGMKKVMEDHARSPATTRCPSTASG